MTAMGLRAQPPELGSLRGILALPPTSWMTLGKVFNFSALSFLIFRTGDNNGTYCREE